MMTSVLHAVAPLLALRMIDSLAWGTVIVVFTLLVLRFTRQSAGARFAMCFSALVTTAALPLIIGEWQSRASIAGASQPVIIVSERWALYLLATWAVIATWFLVGVGRSLWHLHVLRRDCRAVDLAGLDSTLRETLAYRGTSRNVALCTSDQLRVPTLIGLMKPVIVFPAWAMQELSAAELNQILLHELAHLRRWDDWTNLIQQIVKAIFFFHPAVWWMEKRIALEREMACDDAVIAVTASPRAYAECLTHLAERSFIQRSVMLAQAALGKIRQTSARVAQILAPNRPAQSARVWKPAVSLVGACAMVCTVWSAKVPQLIGFGQVQATHASEAVAATNFRNIQSLRSVDVSAKSLQAVHVTPAKFSTQTVRPKPVAARTMAKTPASQKQQIAEMVRLTSVNLTSAPGNPDAVPVTQTFFVVTENPETGSAELHIYQLQMFHITVLHEVIPSPSTRIPHKEI
jgi:beta-lactamase regulating signal transducer with metallopeptidase domain